MIDDGHIPAELRPETRNRDDVGPTSANHQTHCRRDYLERDFDGTVLAKESAPAGGERFVAVGGRLARECFRCPIRRSSRSCCR